MKFKHSLMHNNFSKSDTYAAIKLLKSKNIILTQSKNVRKFEKKWSKWLGVKYSVFVNSGSSANLLTMSVLKILYNKKEIILPDGSKVLLNSGSRIEFPAYFKGEKREVSLVGEAFFDVHRDTLHPFIISTEGVKTQVLGTSFNVNAFPENDSISVSVATGKVRVSDQKGVNEILLPDQQLHYHKNTHAFRKAQKNAIVDRAWTLNTIHLDNKTVKEAVQIIERWFNIKIEIPDGDLAHRKIMGKYQNPELQQTFESLSFLLQARFEEITPETYRIVP